jgi:Trk-type K+ transport system membrane component
MHLPFLHSLIIQRFDYIYVVQVLQVTTTYMTTYNDSPPSALLMIVSYLSIVGMMFAFAWTFRRHIRDGWAAARALADEYNDQYNLDSSDKED